MNKKLKDLYWDILDLLEIISVFISKNWLNYSVYLYAILATVLLLWLL